MPESPPPFYHVSRTTLEIGTVLESRFVKYLFQWDAVASALDEPMREPILKSLLLADSYMGQGKAALPFVLKEVVFERIRAAEFNDQPTRLTAIFLCPTREGISQFREGVRATDDRPHLYSCSTAHDAPLFEADMHYVGGANPLTPIKQQLDDLTERARLYWQGHKCETPAVEILAPSGSVTIATQADW